MDAIGWTATAIFSSSYFFRQPRALRLIQAAAACVWMVYGLAIGALPVVQCVEVRRTGNFLGGIHIRLLSLSAPIANEADC